MFDVCLRGRGVDRLRRRAALQPIVIDRFGGDHRTPSGRAIRQPAAAQGGTPHGHKGLGLYEPGAWQVDNLAVASITNAGELTGLQSGFVTVTATCDGVSASGRTMVQRFAPRVFFSTCDPSASFNCALDAVDVNATVEFLDGPRAGEVMSENAVPAIPPKTLLLPIKIRVSARFYETQEFILSENTSVFEDGGHISFVVLMKFVGDSSTDSYVKTWPNGEIYPFRTRSAGPIEIGTYWHYDDPSHYVRMITELWCDGSRVVLGGEAFGLQHTGVVLSHTMTGPAACEARVPPTEVDRYRLTVTYPH